MWSPHLLGRDPARWDEPTAFRPGRPAAGRDGHGALPFGAGPRMCLGFGLAELEMQLVGARVAQRLDLAPAFAALPPPVGMVTSRPHGGVPAVVTARRPAA